MVVCMCVCVCVCVCTYNEVLPSHKSNEIFPFASTWIEPKGIRQNEISRTGKDKYCVLAYM